MIETDHRIQKSRPQSLDIGRDIYNIYEYVLMMASISQIALSLHYKCS